MFAGQQCTAQGKNHGHMPQFQHNSAHVECTLPMLNFFCYSLDYSFLTCDISLLWMGGKWALWYTVESFMNELFHSVRNDTT